MGESGRGIDYYRLLEVDPRASTEVIQKAYRVLAQRHHPDAGGAGSDPERMRLLNEAYRTLSDPVRREAYDRRRGGDLARLFYEQGLIGLARRWYELNRGGA